MDEETLALLSQTLKSAAQYQSAEQARLDDIYRYVNDGPYISNKGTFTSLPGLPSDVPQELRRLATVSRVNIAKFIVNARVQNCYVDGITFENPDTTDAVMAEWNRNGMDKRQIGMNRSAFTYGAGYGVVLPNGPGIPGLRITGVSPRDLSAVYSVDDDRYPLYAVWRVSDKWHRVFPGDGFYYDVAVKDGKLEGVMSAVQYNAGDETLPVPIVRLRETDDLDNEAVGLVEPIMVIQDQINLTSFGILVTQHFQAFRQRYMIGWTADTESQRLKASASTLFTIDADPESVHVGEFAQAEMSGYLNSREALFKIAATISQTPAHELLGELVNLSAEALAAAEANQRRAVIENQMCLGEDYEQLANLMARMLGYEPESNVSVRWRDTEARSLASVADALGKLATMLSVPVTELWAKIPGVTAEELRAWKAAYDSQAGLGVLQQLTGGVAIAGTAGSADLPVFGSAG